MPAGAPGALLQEPRQARRSRTGCATQAPGNGAVLVLVVVSIALQMVVVSSDAVRFLTVALQA